MLIKRLRYSTNNMISKGPFVLIGWLLITALIIIISGSVFVFLFTEMGDDLHIARIFWISLMRMMFAGNLANEEGSKVLLLSIFIIAFLGLIVIASLIGVITTGLDRFIIKMKKGRSNIVEKNHIVILGWTENIFTLLSELIIANANQRSTVIAVLAEKDKENMEDEIQERLAPNKKVRIVCRSGSSISKRDLNMISVSTSKSIVILPSYTAYADIDVIKSIVLILNDKKRVKPFNIVTKIRYEDSDDLIMKYGQDQVKALRSADFISKIITQTGRQPGLSVVYMEFLSFEGNELYLHRESRLIGKPYKEALFKYDKSAVIGILKEDGQSRINPPMDYLIIEGDQIIVLAEDDDTIVYTDGSRTNIDYNEISLKEVQQKKENYLILNWNRYARKIIVELSNYLSPGSTITVAGLFENQERIKSDMENFPHQHIEVIIGETIELNFLNELNVPDFDHVIVLSEIDLYPPHEADSRMFIILLLLEGIKEDTTKQFSIVSQMNDNRNAEISLRMTADDFIVSDRLQSLFLAQVAENRHLYSILNELLGSEGSELYIRDASNYLKGEKSVNFYTILEAAAERGETAIGYRFMQHEKNIDMFYGLVLNPIKSELIDLKSNDKIIVLSEN